MPLLKIMSSTSSNAPQVLSPSKPLVLQQGIKQQEEMKHQTQQVVVVVEEEEGFHLSSSLSSSSSPSSSLCEEEVVSISKIIGESHEKQEDKDEDEDGYHTPTSPRHRISVTECPWAPKKPSPRRNKKRRAHFFMEITDVESLFGASKKKTREEASIDK